MDQIPVFKPLIEKEEIDAAVEALKMGWLGMVHAGRQSNPTEIDPRW